jgi:hypothetical protein
MPATHLYLRPFRGDTGQGEGGGLIGGPGFRKSMQDGLAPGKRKLPTYWNPGNGEEDLEWWAFWKATLALATGKCLGGQFEVLRTNGYCLPFLQRGTFEWRITLFISYQTLTVQIRLLHPPNWSRLTLLAVWCYWVSNNVGVGGVLWVFSPNCGAEGWRYLLGGGSRNG